MLIIIISVLILILGLILMWIGVKFFKDVLFACGIFIGFIGFLFVVVECCILIKKPLHYKEFKVNYEVISETITNKDDIRDAAFTKEIIEINKEIKRCREFIDNKYIGIFENKKICELELLDKGNE